MYAQYPGYLLFCMTLCIYLHVWLLLFMTKLVLKSRFLRLISCWFTKGWWVYRILLCLLFRNHIHAEVCTPMAPRHTPMASMHMCAPPWHPCTRVHPHGTPAHPHRHPCAPPWHPCTPSWHPCTRVRVSAKLSKHVFACLFKFGLHRIVLFSAMEEPTLT